MDMNLFTIRRCTIEVTLLKACFSAVRDKVIPIVHRKSSDLNKSIFIWI